MPTQEQQRSTWYQPEKVTAGTVGSTVETQPVVPGMTVETKVAVETEGAEVAVQQAPAENQHEVQEITHDVLAAQAQELTFITPPDLVAAGFTPMTKDDLLRALRQSEHQGETWEAMAITRAIAQRVA